MDTSQERGIDTAVRLAGKSQSALARLIDVRPQTVQKWIKAGKPTPEGCLKIERVFGEKCTRAMLDPELFGPIKK